MAYLLFAFAIGCAIPLQAAINNQLKGYVGGGALMAALVSFAVGTVVLAVFATGGVSKWRSLAGLADVKWWHLMGGFLGALFVFGTTFLAPRIGVAKMLSLLIAGQVIVSLVMDHEGWLGLAVREMSFTRVAGGLLVIAGAMLVNYDAMFGKG